MNKGVIHKLTAQLVATDRTEVEAQTGVNASLLGKAGYMQQLSSGLYVLMPLGLRVLNKIEAIVREEMDTLGAAELVSPVLYPREVWDSSGRWDSIDVLYKVTGRSGSQFCLSATAEEVVVHLAKRSIRSYRDLPYAVYQIQSKCRDEVRARSGLIRGREFRMKDLYSFHLEPDQLDQYYEDVCSAYMRVFHRCGIGARVLRTFASGGAFCRFSDEFQLLCESGEDRIYVADDKSVAINSEVLQDEQARRDAFGGREPALTEHRAIEVGNTFKLGSRFTDSGKLFVHDSSGTQRSVLMCSYGIGTTRLVGAIAELCHDEQGLVWPNSVAPYDVQIVALQDDSQTRERVALTARVLRDEGLAVLIDDRSQMRAGEKFSDADLIGIPHQVVVGGRATGSQIEVKTRRTASTCFVERDVLSSYLREEKSRASS